MTSIDPNLSVDKLRASVMARYEPVIGLEVHCQLNTATKLFCACATTFGVAPNHQTCPVCLGLPGALPTLNARAVDLAVILALAVEGEVQETSIFARKQYFYPDLPKGYQISQYDQPYCVGGALTLPGGQVVRLTRIHIEEDAGKSVHEGAFSLIDLNRAGVPLVEIVSEPALHTPQDAAEYLRRLRNLVRFLEVSDGNLEEGSFRCDANVSLRRRGDKVLGTRCEIKNLNSFRNVERAIWYEIRRQAQILDDGGVVDQETRLFDADSGQTRTMRSKEDSPDYRYFPDPDLPPLHIAPSRIEALRAQLPELPDAKGARFRYELGLSEADADLLTSERELATYFEEACAAVSAHVSAKIVANWVTTELLREVNARAWKIAAAPIGPKQLADLLNLIGNGTISGKIAKVVFEEMAESGEAASAIVSRRGLVQISDEGQIETTVKAVLDGNPSQLAQYLAGKEKLYGFFVGQIMKASQGKMNPDLVNEVLKRELATRKRDV